MIAILALAVIGCTKSECKMSADCLQKTCSTSTCDSGKCIYNPTPSCCGNGKQDALENGKPGNKCTCPQDYGRCEGKGKVNFNSREEDAAYLHYLCSSDKCVLGVESSEIAPQNFLDNFDSGYFKASAILKYNKPFDISKDVFEIKITLDDAGKDISLPITLTNVKMLLFSAYSRSELLVAEKDINVALNSVGDTVTVKVPFNLDYKPQEIEELDSIRYGIDYNYIKRIPNGVASDGTATYKAELARDKFNSPSKQVFLVKSG